MLFQVYLDTNFFIEAVEGEGLVSDMCWRLLGLGSAGKIDLWTSELTLAEVLVGPFKAGREPPPAGLLMPGVLSAGGRQWLRSGTLAADYGDILQDGDGLTVVPVDRQILVLAAHWRAERNPPKLPDAIHLATAEQRDCTHIVSGDKKLRPLASYKFQRVSLAGKPLASLLAEAEA